MYSICSISLPNLSFETLDVLKENNFSSIELAPSLISEWQDIKTKILYIEKLLSYEFTVSSMQSIFYGLDNCQLLGSKKEFDNFCNHLIQVCELAKICNTNYLVFGSPNNRQNILNHKHSEIVNRFKVINETVAAENIFFAIEPVPEAYGNMFLNNFNEILEFVSGFDFVIPHFDSGCIRMSGNDPEKFLSDDLISKLKHIHISQNNLEYFNTIEKYNIDVSNKLHRSNYRGTICMETKKIMSLKDLGKNLKNFNKIFKYNHA